MTCVAILATSAIPAWLPDEAHAEKEQLPKDPDAAHHSFHLHIGNRLNHAKQNRQSRMGTELAKLQQESHPVQSCLVKVRFGSHSREEDARHDDHQLLEPTFDTLQRDRLVHKIPSQKRCECLRLKRFCSLAIPCPLLPTGI